MLSKTQIRILLLIGNIVVWGVIFFMVRDHVRTARKIEAMRAAAGLSAKP